MGCFQRRSSNLLCRHQVVSGTVVGWNVFDHGITMDIHIYSIFRGAIWTYKALIFCLNTQKILAASPLLKLTKGLQLKTVFRNLIRQVNTSTREFQMIYPAQLSSKASAQTAIGGWCLVLFYKRLQFPEKARCLERVAFVLYTCNTQIRRWS